MCQPWLRSSCVLLPFFLLCPLAAQQTRATIGKEVSEYIRLEDGDEYQLPLLELLDRGKRIFTAMWTGEEGGGRPLSKGTGNPLSDPSGALAFPRNFNRISAPDANSCAGCHNAPFGIAGGSGDFVTNVFVLGQRFDFATLDPTDLVPTHGGADERGRPVTLGTIANSRSTPGMFGSGFVEMLAREITADLQSIRNTLPPGTSAHLTSKGIHFGTLSRRADGSWDTSRVEGLAVPSLKSAGPGSPPTLIIMPFHQAGAVVSLRQFSNNAFNHHHGMQAEERFGQDKDPDGDGFRNELTRADMTAVSLFQAAMAVPGRVIPNDPEIEKAVASGERLFAEVHCTTCHVPSLELKTFVYSEPNPYNPPTNLRPGDAPPVAVDLCDPSLPLPRLNLVRGIRQFVNVPVYSDFKLHDITSGPDDPGIEALDMQEGPGTDGFFAGNRRFLSTRLWGVFNQRPYFHHGKFTTMREAILAHAGEALESRKAFEALPPTGRDDIIEFLKTLQILPPGTPYRIIDENGQRKAWPH